MLVDALEALDRAASRFRPDSEIARLAAAGGRRVVVSAVLADAVEVALRAAEQTSGDLDPTVGADLAHLGYDRDISELAPGHGLALRPGDAAPEVGRSPDWRDIDVDAARRTVRVPPGVVLDLGATAKARCADLAAAAIAGACGCGVLVSLGGDIAVAGEAPAGGWIVRVQDVTGDPQAAPAGAPTCLVSLDSGGLATSSTHARRWRYGGSVLHHILDPRTGRPADDVWRTVTVAGSTCLAANVASTTAVIRGTAAVRWLEQVGLPARLVRQDGGTRAGRVLLLGGWPREEVDSWTR